MILTLFIFAIINLILAFIDAHRIVKSKVILHGLNGLIYAAMVAVPYFLFHNMWLIASLLLLRLIVFNIMLSLFRGFDWDYMPLNPVSITDKIANKIFDGHGLIMYSVYALLFIVTLVIIFI